MYRKSFKQNKFLDFIGMFLLPYHWAYKRGISEGMRRVDYFKGYADGQEKTHEFYLKNATFKLKNK